MTDIDIINAVIGREGGFVDDADDRGGATKYGVTQVTLGDWLKRPASAKDVLALTIDQARQILIAKFIAAPGFDRINDMVLRAAAVDAGINHGPGNAIRWLQTIAGVAQDGIIGSDTATAVNNLDPRKTCAKFIAARGRFYGRIITNDPNQSKFAAGWLDRLGGFIEELA